MGGGAMPHTVLPAQAQERETVGGADSEWRLLDGEGQELGRVRWDGARPWTPPPGVAQVVPA